MAQPGLSSSPTKVSTNRDMDTYSDSIPSGRASPYDPTPLLALHDYLDQKVSGYSYTYASRDMSPLREEDDEPDEIIIAPTDTNTTNKRQHSRGSPSVTQQEFASNNMVIFDRYVENSDPQTTPAPNPRTVTPPAQLTTRSKSSPADIPRMSQPRRPNWQTIRYQTTPGRTDKGMLAEWIGGWSEDIVDLGDETYCACADSTAAPDQDAPAAAAKKPRKKKSFILSPSSKRNRREYQVMSEDDSKTATEPDSRCSESGAETTTPIDTPPTHHTGAAAAGSRPVRQVGFPVCSNCARQPQPDVAPSDGDLVIHSGGSKIALKVKVVWRSLFGGSHRREETEPTSKTPVIEWEGEAAPGNEDEDDVDIDALSRSSTGLPRRPGEDIAERQARLRRAQKLLRGGGHG